MNSLLNKDIVDYQVILIEYRNLIKNCPGVISILEDDFLGVDINVVIDTKRFPISGLDFPDFYHGYPISIIDIYPYCNSLQNLIDDKVLNDPSLWDLGTSLDIIERHLNAYKKIIRDYEYDLERRRR